MQFITNGTQNIIKTLKKKTVMDIKTDCKYYLAYKPCKFHKQDERLCEDCKDYLPIKTRIIIIKLDALGDVLRTTSILPALAEKYPQCEITWVTKKNAFSLVLGNKYIDRLLAIEENYLQYIQTEHFNLGICLDADPQSASVLNLVDADKKLGFVTEKTGKVVPVSQQADTWWKMGVNDKMKRENRLSYQKHIYDICGLDTEIKRPQIVVGEKALAIADDFGRKHKLNSYKKIIGVNSGGGTRWQYKKWILEYYIEFIRLIKQKHPDYGILLFGGPEEEKMNQTIMQNIPDLLIDTGCNNSIKEFSALIGLTDLFFTSDSLGMHMSVALNIATVVIVGPTSPWELDVYDKVEIIYNKEMPCIACYKATCDFTENCMNSLKPDFVFNKVEKYL